MAGVPGTGDAPDALGHEQEPIPEPAVGGPGHGCYGCAGTTTAGAPAMDTAMVEMTGDLQEYGLSLGVDLEIEAEEDLAWAVQEAFNAPLPSSWTEYMDDSGRAYYIKDGSSASTWEHPMDGVYRDLLALVKEVRQRTLPATAQQREDVVQMHLKQVHLRAKEDLQGWNGPYGSEQGEYYYSDKLNISSWDNPALEWEQELVLRHMVLVRYLMPEQQGATGADGQNGSQRGVGAHGGQHMLQALRLQLGSLQRHTSGGSGPGDAPEPSTSRSYHTARSHGSSRSGRSRKDRKERKDHRRGAGEAELCGVAASAGGGLIPSALPENYAAALLPHEVRDLQ